MSSMLIAKARKNRILGISFMKKQHAQEHKILQLHREKNTHPQSSHLPPQEKNARI